MLCCYVKFVLALQLAYSTSQHRTEFIELRQNRMML